MQDREVYWTENPVCKEQKDYYHQFCQDCFWLLEELKEPDAAIKVDEETKVQLDFIADALEFALKRKFRGMFDNQKAVEKCRENGEAQNESSSAI